MFASTFTNIIEGFTCKVVLTPKELLGEIGLFSNSNCRAKNVLIIYKRIYIYYTGSIVIL